MNYTAFMASMKPVFKFVIYATCVGILARTVAIDYPIVIVLFGLWFLKNNPLLELINNLNKEKTTNR